MKHWKTVLKEKQRKAYKERFAELLDRSGNFPQGYIQELDFAYKDSVDIFRYQPYLKKVTQTSPVITIKYSEI
jgi:tRNA-splicing ligase RtcB/release factor H-coupled RctB family protein